MATAKTLQDRGPLLNMPKKEKKIVKTTQFNKKSGVISKQLIVQ